MLGHHLQEGDKSLEAYSRDSMAGPLRELDAVITQITAGTFLPDATRSGMFAGPLPGAAARTLTMSSRSSSSSTSCSSCSSADASDIEKEVDDFDGTILVNTATKCCHIADNKHKMRCGKPWPDKYSIVECLPAKGGRCKWCF